MWCPEMGCHIKREIYKEVLFWWLFWGGFVHEQEKSDLQLQHWAKQSVD